MPTQQATEAPTALPDYEQPQRPLTATSGLPATGPGGRGRVTTGCAWSVGRASTQPRFGHRATGALWQPLSLLSRPLGPAHPSTAASTTAGYVGFGYEGGYWNSGHFFYNRVYNNINVRTVRNVYSYRASNRGNYNGGNRGNYNAGNRGNDNYGNSRHRQQTLAPATAAEAACNIARSLPEGAAAHRANCSADRIRRCSTCEQNYGGMPPASMRHRIADGLPPPAVSRPIPDRSATRSLAAGSASHIRIRRIGRQRQTRHRFKATLALACTAV